MSLLWTIDATHMRLWPGLFPKNEKDFLENSRFYFEASLS